MVVISPKSPDGISIFGLKWPEKWAIIIKMSSYYQNIGTGSYIISEIFGLFPTKKLLYAEAENASYV